MWTSLRYGFWDEWENPQRCTFSGAERIIYINPGVTEIDVKRDIYSDWKEWMQADDDVNSKWLPAVRTIGGDAISETEQLGDTYFLMNGWRIMPWEGSYRLSVTGNLYTDEGDSPFIPTRNPSNVAIVQRVSSLVLQPLVTVQTDNTISEADIAAITSSVWSDSNASDIINKLAEAWGRLGLDPSKPLITGQNSITFGDIVMAMTGDATQTTVTRQ